MWPGAHLGSLATTSARLHRLCQPSWSCPLLRARLHRPAVCPPTRWRSSIHSWQDASTRGALAAILGGEGQEAAAHAYLLRRYTEAQRFRDSSHRMPAPPSEALERLFSRLYTARALQRLVEEVRWLTMSDGALSGVGAGPVPVASWLQPGAGWQPLQAAAQVLCARYWLGAGPTRLAHLPSPAAPQAEDQRSKERSVMSSMHLSVKAAELRVRPEGWWLVLRLAGWLAGGLVR